MVTLLRPHEGVMCPELTVPEIEKGLIRTVNHCKGCEHVKEIRSPWHGFAVKCKLEGDDDNVTVEYG